MLIVGSKALIYHFPEIDRVANDTDVIIFSHQVDEFISKYKPEKVNKGDGIVSLINTQHKDNIFDTKNIELLLADESDSFKGYLSISNDLYASPEILFSLKKSHIHFPIHFKKHISDYVFLNNFFNGKDSLSELTHKNYLDVEKRFGKLKTPSLNKSVKEFFGQSEGYVKSYFIHDDIHKIVAHYDEPLYLRMQEDKTMAKCHKYLWDKFSYEDKCKCVLEEAYSIALERKIIPVLFGKSNKWMSSEEALNWSLMRVCTTLCSGWFREFATNNFFNIKNFINKNYVEDFLENYQNGKIKKMD